MHVGEERFRCIRMSEHEFASLRTAFAELIDDTSIEIAGYPMLDKFLAALGYAGGYHDSGDVVAEIELEDD